MGMTIDDAIKYYSNKNVVLTEEEALANTVAINTMRKYQQLQADYENRLKADMVAMLEEIDLEMSEQSFGIQTEPWEVVEKLRKKIIQQKINALKAEKGEEDDK